MIPNLSSARLYASSLLKFDAVIEQSETGLLHSGINKHPNYTSTCLIDKHAALQMLVLFLKVFFLSSSPDGVTVSSKAGVSAERQEAVISKEGEERVSLARGGEVTDSADK